MSKLIITAALVGAETSKQDNANLPTSPAELAAAAYACWQAGASIVHLHVRDEAEQPTQDVAIFAEAKRLIEERCDIIIQFSTGGAVGLPVEERTKPLSLRPEMATLTTGTVNFGSEVFFNSQPYIEGIAQALLDNGVKPEIEIFDVGMIDNALRLVRQELVAEPLHFDFVMGVPGGIGGTVKNLLHLVESIPAGSTWSVAGIGRTELPLATMAIIMGGHVRVGFEDNIYYSRGVKAESNAQLVARIVRLAGELGREVASPNEARALLGMALK